MEDLSGTGAALEVLAAIAVGAVSAVLPVVNAEAVVLAAAVGRPRTAVPVVLGVALGQTLGKVALMVAARHGAHRLVGLLHHPRSRVRTGGAPAGAEPPGAGAPPPRTAWWARAARAVRRWGERCLAALDSGRWAGPVVLLSATTGVPPLAVTSIAAGLRRTPVPLFTVCCLLGRSARFLALGLPALAAT
ncbi:hypothetical protein [Kineococcus sp. SYSU DK018]|uniref:hypothetical protein n=1 Tax=Kineococcus sp. SYSU DK018 TaxID=3383139 RepID=UPI003D7CFEA4